MSSIYLGRDHDTGAGFSLPTDSFKTHWHLIGGTGKGKTTAIEAMLHQLFRDRHEHAAHFIIDRLGSFSFSLLLWLASRFCPEWVRRRLVYLEPSREDVCMPWNPLTYDTPAHGYFKVGRAVECILRAWASQNIEEMPRLARWVFNAFWAAAQLGLTIPDSVHLLMPGSPYHGPLLQLLPPLLQAEWAEILHARGGEAGRILESSRNRLKPYFENVLLRNLFGSTRNHFDALRFMREGRIVLVNLAPKNRLSPQIADAFGGIVLNEILATARSLPMGVRHPTYVWLDEFQRYVSPDIEEAIPEVRQLGIRLILSHQSFAQLKQGDTDLTSIIWQAQSRMMFGVQGEDADLLAHEIASLRYDPKLLKEEMYTRRQLQKGHRIMELSSWSEAQGAARQWSETFGQNWSDRHTITQGNRDREDVFAGGSGSGANRNESKGGSETTTRTRSIGQTLVPEIEEFLELSSRNYFTFDEQRTLWAQFVRGLKTGQALVRLVNDSMIHTVDVQRDAPGLLELDIEMLARKSPQTLEAAYRLIEENFRSDLFVSPQVIEAETQERLERLLRPTITVQPPVPRLEDKRLAEQPLQEPAKPVEADPFS